MVNERSIGIVNNLDNYVYHILGCGAIGSSTAIQLARMGAKEITLYDFDEVEKRDYQEILDAIKYASPCS